MNKLWELKAQRDAEDEGEEEADACKPAQTCKEQLKCNVKASQKPQSGHADKNDASLPDRQCEDVQKLLDTIKQEREERQRLQQALEAALTEQEAAKARAREAEGLLQKAESEEVKQNECL
jgi:hypothetical protein